MGEKAGRGGESIHQLVTKSLLSPPEDLVPCRAAQWGSQRKKEKERGLYFVATKDTEMELLHFGDPHAAPHSLPHYHSREGGCELLAAADPVVGSLESSSQGGIFKAVFEKF